MQTMVHSSLFLVFALALVMNQCRVQAAIGPTAPAVTLTPADPGYYTSNITLNAIGCTSGQSITAFTHRIPSTAPGTPLLVQQNCGTISAGRLDFTPNRTMVAGADGTVTILVVIGGRFTHSHGGGNGNDTAEQCSCSDSLSRAQHGHPSAEYGRVGGFISVDSTFSSNGCAASGVGLKSIDLCGRFSFARYYIVPTGSLYVRFCIQACKCATTVQWAWGSQVTVYYNAAPPPLPVLVIPPSPNDESCLALA